MINPSTSVSKIAKIADKHFHLLVAKWSNLPEKALNAQQLDVLQEVKPSAFFDTETTLTRNARTGQESL